MRPLAAAILLTVPLLATANARADDAAVAELKTGYALKQAGKCQEALPHFLASYKLSPSAKSLLNLADCESRTGDLVSAKVHAAQGRELARQGHDGHGAASAAEELVSVADELLASVEKRTPRLTIKLSAGTPADCTVVRDGTVVDSATLGTSVAANPGPHTITVTAAGHDDRTYPISLAESQRTELLVEAGPPVAPLPANPYSDHAPTPLPSPPDQHQSTSLWATLTATPRNEVSATLVGGGVLAVAVGSGFGIAAISNNGASNSNSHCNTAGCDPTGVDLRNSALRDATVSTIFFGVGLAAVGGGIALYLTAPRSSGSTVSVRLAPLVNQSSGGLGLLGTW